MSEFRSLPWSQTGCWIFLVPAIIQLKAWLMPVWAQVTSLHTSSLVWNSQTDLRLQRKGLHSIQIAYARFLASPKSRTNSWNPNVWNSRVETQEGTTGRGDGCWWKIDGWWHLLQAAPVTLLDPRQGTRLVASGQAPEVQVVQQGSGGWRPEERISCCAKRFNGSALRVCKISEYNFIVL